MQLESHQDTDSSINASHFASSLDNIVLIMFHCRANVKCLLDQPLMQLHENSMETYGMGNVVFIYGSRF